MTAALVFALTTVGMTEASTTRRPETPYTSRRGETTAEGSPRGPIRALPATDHRELKVVYVLTQISLVNRNINIITNLVMIGGGERSGETLQVFILPWLRDNSDIVQCFASFTETCKDPYSMLYDAFMIISSKSNKPFQSYYRANRIMKTYIF